ncbi:MAG: HAMP domain-containing sensor histidine kinase [Candidatus Izemoplasmatales bacterium]
MISFKIFFKQRMARFLIIMFASLLLFSNLAVYLIANVQSTRQIERQDTAFATLLEHLIIYESVDTSIVYAEHYTHAHRINLIYKDEDNNILYQSDVLPNNGKQIILYNDANEKIGEVILDYQSSFISTEVTVGLIVYNIFSLMLFSGILIILFKYLNKQNAILQKDMNNIGKEQEVFTFKDISNINERYVKALKIEKDLIEMQKHYVQLLAHDVKTPLTVMKAYLEGVKLGRIKFDEKINEDLLSEIDSIEKLVPQIIAMDIIQIEKTQNIAPIIENKLKKLQEVFMTKNITLKYSLDNFEMKVSEYDITRIIEHLVFNAFYYSNPKNTVQVTLDASNHKLTVADTGIGMTQTTIDKIYSGPHRSESSTKYNKKGNGIGLQIVFEIINRLNASIAIESKIGLGTKISISF